jgi:DNA primase
MANGRIPDEIIEAVLERQDIVDVVGKHVHLTKQGHYMKGLCPFHSEKSPSFTVTPEKQIYHCFGCGAGGNAIQFVMEIGGYSFGEAVRLMAEEAGIPVDWDPASDEQTQQQAEKAALLKAHELASKLYQYILRNTDQGKTALAYTRSRGLSDKLMDTFQIGYAPTLWDTLVQLLHKRGFDLSLMEKGGLISSKSEGNGYTDRFRDRVLFPICDAQGNVIAFGGRAMGDMQPKYLNSPETPLFNKSRSLFHLHQARPIIRKTQQIVLFEGYLDVIKAWEAGVHNGVATMGTALTGEHAEIIRRNAEHVVICYDGDAAGQAAAFKSIPLLEKAGCRITIGMLPDGKDPDEYITAYGHERFINEIMDAAVPAIKFKLLYVRRNFKLQEEGERLRYLHTAANLIAELHSPIEREHYLKQLSIEFDSSYEAMKQDMAETRLRLEKKGQSGDNNPNPWNNVMNNGKRADRAPKLLPAYHNAERQLIAAMMHDREVCKYVEQHLGDAFNVDTHAVLAAYLYAFYAAHDEPNVSAFLAMLREHQLEGLASSIVMIGTSHIMNEQVIDDYIREIRKVPLQREVAEKREDMIGAEQAGDVRRAAQILIEIITLEKQLGLRK